MIAPNGARLPRKTAIAGSDVTGLSSVRMTDESGCDAAATRDSRRSPIRFLQERFKRFAIRFISEGSPPAEKKSAIRFSPAGIRLTSSGTSRATRSKSSTFSSTPIRLAMAIK